MQKLPIEDLVPDIRARLAFGRTLVLQAPPGAGKTTRVPLALLNEPWMTGQRILVLEPRRLAARLAARYMASQLSEAVGETVGYRMRLDTRVGRSTRIEVMTEGVLTRLIQSDPDLVGVGLVIFDEFHERHLHSDLALALCIELQQVLRPELRILVMSATLDAAPVAALLSAPIITSEGRAFPVETQHLTSSEQYLDRRVARAVQQALETEHGNVLVFLPGTGEIKQVVSRLSELRFPSNVRVEPLFGNMSAEEQERAIMPPPPGERKVVLATAIAETSLTIEGIRVVIDSGFMRVPEFDVTGGMTRLVTIRVSLATATQRAGRAGRLEPGICYRLWSAHEQQGLVPNNTPEILAADLAPLALELAQWGVDDVVAMSWLTPPPAAALAQAQDLLRLLTAVDEAGKITLHGRKMQELGVHPRLAHMLLRGKELGWGDMACSLAALIEERDILRGSARLLPVEISIRLELLQQDQRGSAHSVDRSALLRVRETARHLARQLGVGDPSKAMNVDCVGLLLAFAYPDRIGAARGSRGRFLLSNGRGAVVAETELLARDEFVVAARLDGDPKEAKILLGSRVAKDALLTHFSAQLVTNSEILWDDKVRAVSARRLTRLGELVLRDEAIQSADPAQVLRAVLGGVRSHGLSLLNWDAAAVQLRARIALLRRLTEDGARFPGVNESWPDMSNDALLRSVDEWLGAYLQNVRNADQLQKIVLHDVLSARLTWSQRQQLDELAPTHWVVPTGSRIAIDYGNDATPVLAVRLQELFGLRETPAIAAGRLPLKLHLLSPAYRPVQVTQDLASFWANTYQEVKRDLKGRYPKHHWPEDPLQAAPIRGVKRPR